MNTHFLVYTLLLGLALYPLVSNHSSNQRENALSVIGSLIMAFVIIEQSVVPTIEETSIAFASLCVSSYLFFALGYLNRAPTKNLNLPNPVPPILLGALATGFDAFLYNEFESLAFILIQFVSLIYLTHRYKNPSVVNRRKAYFFATLYSSVWTAHIFASSDNDYQTAWSLTAEWLANLLVFSAFLHMLWQDYSKTRTRKLSRSTLIVEPDAVRLSYQARRVLKDVRHDLRQPISTLGILASVGKAIARDPEVITRYEHIQAAQKALKTMLEQTFGLLDRSLQYPQPQAPQNFDTFPINELLEPLIVEYRYLANNKGLQIRYKPTSLCVCSDREGLTKIIRNGLDNAIKYTQEGGVVVMVKKRGDSIAIQIVDTGPGVESDSVAIHRKGWGHGSTIVRDLSDQLGVQTSVRNRIIYGQVRGSIFEVITSSKPNPGNQSEEDEISTGSKVIAEILVNGPESRAFLEDHLPVGAFDEVRFGKLNLYRSYTTSIRKGAASVYVAYATSEEELEIAHQSLKTICRLLGGNPCCVVLYVDEEERTGHIEFDDNLIYLAVKKDNPNAFSAFSEFFPEPGKASHKAVSP